MSVRRGSLWVKSCKGGVRSCAHGGTAHPRLSVTTLYGTERKRLLVLVTILSQSLLTLVGGHLVAFFLFSVWHNSGDIELIITVSSQ